MSALDDKVAFCIRCVLITLLQSRSDMGAISFTLQTDSEIPRLKPALAATQNCIKVHNFIQIRSDSLLPFLPPLK